METVARAVHHGLVRAVRAALEAAADPTRAAPMQAYMKSTMPFLGVSAPARTVALRPVLADPTYRLGSGEEWEGTVRTLWDKATFREERYAALAITGHRLYREWPDPASVPLLHHLVTSGAWWDFVDVIASRRVGPALRAHPSAVAPVLRDWAGQDDLWLRRTAILSQLSSGDGTDRELLLDCIDPNVEDREFFVRKAIGWALRQETRSTGGADWVREVVAAFGARLSPLSRREALKHL